MALPSERLAAVTSRAAAGAIFRLVAVWLGLGVLDLLGAGLRWLIVTTTDPGEGSGALASLVRVYRSDGSGEAWMLYFLLATTAFLVAEAAALVWALRPEASAPPPLLLGVGLAGLVARLLSFGAGTTISFALGNESASALSSYAIASSVADMLHLALSWIVSIVALLALFVRVLRQPRLDEREGPYREAAG